jgi:hypothetical protein
VHERVEEDAVLVDVGAVGPSTAVVAVPVANPAPPPGRGEEFGKASPIALVVVVILGLATVVLVRSMTKRIRRLPASFERPPGQGEAPAHDGKDAGGQRG